jgi:hypothetical protein
MIEESDQKPHSSTDPLQNPIISFLCSIEIHLSQHDKLSLPYWRAR